MIAICDCNSFYASCHPLFDPELWDKPVVVLSNNRGVIVSLNKKAKEIGLKRGFNEFENRQFFRKHNVAVFESNYELYYDMSERVMTNLAKLVDRIQIYSIDEAFLLLDGYERFGFNQYGLHIANTVKKTQASP